jgi:Recombination endonuclease VII
MELDEKDILTKRKITDKLLRKRVGITLDQKERIFANQGYKCGCCGEVDPQHKNGWFVDHNHKTGAIRGVVCHPCNMALGHSRESIERLEAAIKYLELDAQRKLLVLPTVEV